MKIAIFTDTFAPDVNGVAKTLKRFTNYLDNKGLEYRVFAPESTNKDLFSSQVHRFASLPFFLYPECRLALPNMLSVKAELLKFKPDLIHVATPFNIGLCGLHYAKKLDIPVVGSYHTDFDKYLEYYDLQFLTKVLWSYMRWFHRPLRKIFVPSTDTQNHLNKHGITNTAIWPRGVDCSIFYPRTSSQLLKNKFNIKEKHILTYVGRLAPEKDVTLLPKIQASLPPSIRHDVHWLIVGDGPLKQELHKDAPDNMSFAGFQSGQNLAEIYAGSDVFVFPSPTETFGNVVLESLASGTPVVGANAGGVKTIINQGVTGHLCNQNDAVSFASAITSLIEDDEKREQMGYAGRHYALEQSWDTIFERLLQDYKAALEPQKLQILA
ncbi:glycosyltransferase family 4 protein [Sutcliffiella horikoshii]|uniref:Glycosyl transferase n=1 Tax=Sutcliffiella horikoshii TaxID=79883 RepID=A0A1Y0CQS4_9BACI|nr:MULTISPECIES: glycosyltransferase family 1 protein [Bacillaceae]ART77720.1 glycosyl transferase [Sutcliffiella horikoshii]TYS55685.1 glycosyltransferase family 1 protein [Sutcliffiella horikoshii]TYS71457.1 glycosyltransferase family 1 protein [Sutcliffiella horikoshii]